MSDKRLSFKLQEKLTQAVYPTRPTLYYLRVDGGKGMRRYLARTMTRQKFETTSAKLRKAVHALNEQNITIHVATEGFTLI
jgi:hypothetical protein